MQNESLKMIRQNNITIRKPSIITLKAHPRLHHLPMVDIKNLIENKNYDQLHSLLSAKSNSVREISSLGKMSNKFHYKEIH